MRPVFGTAMMSLDLAIGLWPVTLLALAAGIWGAVALVRARRLRTWQVLSPEERLSPSAAVVCPGEVLT